MCQRRNNLEQRSRIHFIWLTTSPFIADTRRCEEELRQSDSKAARRAGILRALLGAVAPRPLVASSRRRARRSRPPQRRRCEAPQLRSGWCRLSLLSYRVREIPIVNNAPFDDAVTKPLSTQAFESPVLDISLSRTPKGLAYFYIKVCVLIYTHQWLFGGWHYSAPYCVTSLRIWTECFPLE